MDSLTPCEPVVPGASAVADTRARLRKSAPRQLQVVGALSLGIALILTAIDGRGFGTKLIYSVSVAAVCTLIVNGTRLAWAWAIDLRRQPGVPALQDSAAVIGWRGAVPGAFAAMLAGPPIGLWLGDRMTGYETASLLDLASSSTRVTLVISVVATVICIVVISSLERLSAARAQAEAAQRQAAEHQLRLLQSQLEPHMLFNTLANLRVLIGLEPERAQAMLDRLISFLRATLNASRLAAHPLATEFDRIADYLALMGVRMGPRLQVSLELPDSLRALPVPPLLMQPLVENAIKHGLEPHVQGGRVTVSASVEGDSLVLSVRDTGSGLPGTTSSASGSRFGLAQVRERLATLHGTQASLSLQAGPPGEGGTVATIRLPLPTTP